MAEPYLGEIRMFGGTFAPQGWVPCDGRLLSISDNEPLFALLGTTYGGDGQSNFGVPDLRGRAPIHRSSVYPLGVRGGTETVTLTVPEMAAHTHLPNVKAGNGSSSTPAGSHWAGNNDFGCYAHTAPNASFNPGAIGPAGGNQPHDNMMPFTTVSFIIATAGIYPQSN
jgi:microcystin-dependent protein